MSPSKKHLLYLNGKWVNGTSAVSVKNPATGETIGEVSTIGRDGVRQAIADARAAFPAWKSLTALARADYLHAIAAALASRRDEIARTITLENGKPLAQSQGEVAMSVDHLRWFAEEGRRAYGRVVPPQAAGKRHLVLKSPVGVVGAVAPWNFPLVLCVRKVAPALAAGCPVILKPARATPLSAVALAQCIDEAKLPPSVFQLVAGDSRELVGEMLANPACAKITFTGSTEVGRELIRGAADTVTRLSLELGGHAPLIVFDDADLDGAVEGAMIAKFRNTGQSCIAANRIYVQSGIYKQFLDRFVSAVGRLKTGNGLEPGVDVGPLINREGLEKALRHIDDAKKRGAKVLCGGNAIDGPGAFLEPTVLADVGDDALCMGEETFAPLAPICSFDDENEAVRRANSSPFGLAAYVFTNNLHRAFRVFESLEAGSIGVNDGVPTTSQCEFGGYKQSGWGRELGMEGLEAFLETKHVAIAGFA